jgi:succinyl-CoA synthetase beta subunit
MKLNDHQTLSLLSRFHIPVATSFPIKTKEEIEPLLAKYEITKGVVKVENQEESTYLTKDLLKEGLQNAFESEKEQKIFLGQFLEVEYELYLSVMVDKKTGEHILWTARGRKKNTEVMSRETCLGVYREVIPLGKKLYLFQKKALFYSLELPDSIKVQYFQIIDRLLALYFSLDALSIELNPIAVVYPTKLVVSHAGMEVDNFAFFRQPEMRYFFEKNLPHTKTEDLKKLGMQYGSSVGSVAILAMGQALLDALSDLIRKNKGKVGSYIALSEEFNEEVLPKGMSALLEDPGQRVLLITLFYGMKGVDGCIAAILSFLKKAPIKKTPIVLCMEAATMRGVKEQLSSLDWPLYLIETLEEAVSLTVSLSI